MLIQITKSENQASSISYPKKQYKTVQNSTFFRLRKFLKLILLSVVIDFNIYSEDKMQGKTNAITSSRGSSATTVTAVNKTGKAIAKGDKVWLNSNAKIMGSKYSINVSNSGMVMSRTGNFASDSSNLFSLGADSATNIGKFSRSTSKVIKYLPDNSVFIGNTDRSDDNAQYSTSFVNLSGENYAFYGSSGNSKIHLFNISDGSVMQTWTSTDAHTFLSTEGVKVGNYFYRLVSNARYKCHLGDDGKIVYDGNFTYDNPHVYSLYPLGVTADNKYIICNTANANDTYLRMVEVIDDNHLKCLTQSEMPADLQEFYSASCYVTFNRYTGVLTVAKNAGAAYAVVKYNNGVWNKLNVDLGAITSFSNPITLSDDLSRACVQTSGGSYAVNLSTTSGFAAMSYRFYTNSEDTITGYALEDALPEANFNAQAAAGA